MTRSLTPLLLLTLVACTKDGAAQDSHTGEEEEPEPVELVCAQAGVDVPISTGLWSAGIDEALLNDCENSAGKGLHIHVGENTMLDVDGSALPTLVMVSDPGSEQTMEMTGSQDGEDFSVTGTVELEIGTCIVGIEATLTGRMTGQESFCYRMDATADIAEELSPDACSLIIGDTENHTFPKLPCEQAWQGTASPAP